MIIHNWTEINLPWGREYSEKDSFCKQQLNKAGTLIELKSGDVLLIGDINELSGICDGCTAILEDTIIKRYKIIWKK